jgi:hypothetical protein
VPRTSTIHRSVRMAAGRQSSFCTGVKEPGKPTRGSRCSAPSRMELSRATLYVGGHEAQRWPITAQLAPLRLRASCTVTVPRDS